MGRRKVVGGILGLGAAAAIEKAQDAHAKAIAPEEARPGPQERLEKEFQQMRVPTDEYYEGDAEHSPNSITNSPDMVRINDWVEVDKQIVDTLNEDPEHCSLNFDTGELRITSLREGRADAAPPLEHTFDPSKVRLLRIVGLPEANGFLFTILTKDDFRQRAVVRRNFRGDHFINLEDPVPLMNMPGEKSRL
jgi:hypothetical protein